MDDDRFDALARFLGQGVSRRAAAARLAALGGMGLAGLDNVDARKGKKGKKKANKKKKAKKNKERCLRISERPCRTDEECCEDLVCRRIPGCPQPDLLRCCGQEDEPCDNDCDCCIQFSCAPRQGNTCQDCAFLSEICDTEEDCCRLTATCDVSACGADNRCCHDIGLSCTSQCDCCEGLVCNFSTDQCDLP
ncbi:MAG: hypothetical protein ACRDJC_13265 [Thermomicrobiales bacterium]